MKRTFAGLGLLLSLSAQAYESDQFNLTPEPLADIGMELTNHVMASLQAAVDNANQEIAKHERCIARLSGPSPYGDFECGIWTRHASDPRDLRTDIKIHKEDLAKLLTREGIGEKLYDELGAGFPTSKVEKWFAKHDFAERPALFRERWANSAFYGRPFVYLTLAHTVKIFGVEMGTDKIGHFFQQGRDYLKIYEKELKKGKTVEQATRKAIDAGKGWERGKFGTLVSAVYSNSDLAANYAGLLFFLNLTEPVTVRGHERPALTKFENNRWSLNTAAIDTLWLMSDFMSDHLNEALNPSIYGKIHRDRVKYTLHTRACAQWKSRLGDEAFSRLPDAEAQYRTWFGADYGFTSDRKEMISIGSECGKPFDLRKISPDVYSGQPEPING